MVKSLKKGKKLGDKPREIEYRKEHACKHTPNIFEYLAYMTFFVHALCGSNVTINEFLFINDRTLFKKMDGRIHSMILHQALQK